VSVRDLTAVAHPQGERIDLTWTISPGGPAPTSVVAVRRLGSHPETPTDGTLVEPVAVGPPGPDGVRCTATDTGLRGGTVYYYTLFPPQDPEENKIDASVTARLHHRTAAMATSPYGFAERMYRLLPAIYRRYDTVRSLAAADSEHAQLRRFLDLPGTQLDALYSLVRAGLDLHDLDRVDGRLLPLLSQWIGWPTDDERSVGRQRADVRHAPWLYPAVGTIPAMEAMATRITGWPCRARERIDQVARTNTPARASLWSMLRDGEGRWGGREHVSLDSAVTGRVVALDEGEGSLTLVYHTDRDGPAHIRAKVRVMKPTGAEWEPSYPLVGTAGDHRRPTAALHEGERWVFWERRDTSDHAGTPICRIWYRAGDAEPTELPKAGPTGSLPTAVTADEALWLIFLRDGEPQWLRHTGADWGDPVAVPPDGGSPVIVQDDMVGLGPPIGSPGPLVLFWSTREPGPGGSTRWTVHYRVRASVDPDTDDWSAVGTLPGPDTGIDTQDREPAPRWIDATTIELFVSSTRRGTWDLYRTVLHLDGPDVDAHRWDPVEPVAAPAPGAPAPTTARRAPAVAGPLLVFRSAEPPPFTSDLYGTRLALRPPLGATTTVDTRAGVAAARQTFGDVLSYTPATGRVAENVIVLYLAPPTGTDRDERRRTLARLRAELPTFMPVARSIDLIEET